jgi:hypothetical protein
MWHMDLRITNDQNRKKRFQNNKYQDEKTKCHLAKCPKSEEFSERYRHIIDQK